jgi:regulator of sigma E protease
MIVVVGFLLIILLVIAHEAGHFWAARRNGIEVEEFGIGFPPRAKVIGKKNGTVYTLNWLPLGGFVKLKGEHDSDTTPGSFGAASLKNKIKVMTAGVAMNLLVAYLLFTVIALIGMPKLVDNQFNVASDNKIVRHDVIAAVGVEAPAPKAGVEQNDKLKRIEQVSNCEINDCIVRDIKVAEDLKDITKSLAGETIILTHVRDGQELSTSITLNTTEFVEKNRAEVESCFENEAVEDKNDCPELQSYLGVVPSDFIVQRATWSAPIVGAGVTYQFSRLTLNGLGSIVTGLAQGDTEAATEQVSGVVGVGYIFSSSSFLGPVFMLMIVAVISLSLAIMNILPIPALDGGRLFVTLFYRSIKRPLTQSEEEKIHGTGFALLMVLFVLITVLDVQRFIL